VAVRGHKPQLSCTASGAIVASVGISGFLATNLGARFRGSEQRLADVAAASNINDLIPKSASDKA